MTGLNINLNMNTEATARSNTRVKKAAAKKKEAEYQPTLDEVFKTGYTTATGKHKKGLAELRNTDSDKAKIKEVYAAIKSGELGTGLTDMKKFSKAHCLGLYQTLRKQRMQQTIQEMIKNKPDNYHLVDNVMALRHMTSLLADETEFALDTETTGITHDDVIVGYSVTCPKANQHFYVPYGHTTGDKQLPKEQCLAAIKPFIEDSNRLKVLANVKFDYKKFVQEGIYMNNFVDVQVLMYVLNENEPSYKLKDLASKYGKHFGFPNHSDTYEDLFGTGGFQDTPLDIGHIYACKDTHLTWALYQWQLEHLRKQPKLWHVAFDIETPLTPVLLKMELRGFNVDLKYAEEYREALEAEIQELERQLADYFPNVNLNSNQQLAKFLFEDLGLEKVKGDSVDKDTLKVLADEYEGIKILLDYRKKEKMLSTYIIPLPQMIWEDGYLHGELNQRGTKTGRLSSNNPNLQNIPPEARKIFVAPEGKMYMSCDFSKMEIFIACELSGDPNLYEALHSGADVYSVIASKSYGLPIEQCGDGTIYRKHAKTALLGCMYGALPFTIARQLDVSVEEGEEILNNFFGGNPVLTAQIEKCHRLVDTQGYVETMQGRKRRFPEIPAKVKLLNKINEQIKYKTGKTGNEWEKELGSIFKAKKVPYNLKSQWYDTNKAIQAAYRQSFNATDQGSSGDICKISLINIQKYFDELNSNIPDPKDWYYLVSSIHDEQLMEVPDNIPAEVIDHIQYLMCNTMPLHVHMRCDVEFYKRYYYDGKSIEQVLAGDLPKID